MTKQELLAELEATVPYLKGKLHAERVLYKADQNRAYISYLCDELVERRAFTAIENKLRELFPGMGVSLRVATPSLGEDFIAHIERYEGVLKDFLLHASPAIHAWLEDVGWSVEDGRVLLTCPDDNAIAFFEKNRLGDRLAQAIWNIFRVRVTVALTRCGQREEWVRAMRAQRARDMHADRRRAREAEAHEESALGDEPEPSTSESGAVNAGAGWDESNAGAGFESAAAGWGVPDSDVPNAALACEHAAPTYESAAPGDAPPASETTTPRAARAPRPKKAQEKGDTIKGRAIADPPVEIGQLLDDSGLVVIEGVVTGVAEPKALKGGESVLVAFALYDDTSTIYCKAFYRYSKRGGRFGEEPKPPTDEERARVNEQIARIKNGVRARVRGECAQDHFLGELCVTVRDMQLLPVRVRTDTAAEKRVELHMHSNMSAMDATADVAELIAQAAAWGHKAVAITDHGVTQAFPAAFGAAKKHGVKLIPGVEGYLCDVVGIVEDATDAPLAAPIVVIDFETTGLSPAADRIIEIGAARLENGRVTDELSLLCDPGVPLRPMIVEKTGITDLMLRGKESPAQAVEKLLAFIGDSPVAAHNAPFDMGFLQAECARMGVGFRAPVIDTLTFSRRLFPDKKSHKLASVCKLLGVSLKNAHRAVHDARATAQCLQRMLESAEKLGAATLRQIDGAVAGESLSSTWHIILLCKTQKGMENLNHLVSESHLNYFNRHPNLPRALIAKYRDGLIVGSACEAGELFHAVEAGRSDAELERIAAFYDYLEIQPVGNNRFLVREGRARDDEQLRDYNRRIVALGERLGKPVVATGDVHFKDPQDAVYRAILQAGQGYEDCDEQPPLFFKTTDEMLAEFAYLGADKAREVVIDAPARIADQIDALRLFPKHPKGEETFQPYWEEAAGDIESCARARAAQLYGDPLPELIDRRLDKELKSIIGFGFATLYSIAQKLVQKSLGDGYLVGSRGSVGSSFVATMCGITEVNPLPPHYRCDHCHRAFFTDPSLASVGVDLPDKRCEVCGGEMVKDGFDIPFEVFLGFNGDKVPDIDLNFSGDYQARAHAYIEALFGKGYVYRAGTISGLAEKTAYGFAAKYLETRGLAGGRAHRERLAAGCVGVKRTTGQHPGGIVVLPKDYDICQFTAIQHPADDVGGSTLTTHYDFRSMHDILVKLDCLGHDDPTMIHRLEELTGVSYKSIPLDDERVMSLFLSPEALGLTTEALMSPTGTLGVPEFGTEFVQGMLMDTKPTLMEELIRISGLSHGTDVWLGNAKELVDSGTATLRQCICTRDDIMNYLMSMGVDSKMSFDTMESVRKGKGLTPEMERAMAAARVPEWFVKSCKKIKYMFPKGHAVAYVTMALRVAWFKVYHPLAYYAAYFSIRADGFDAARMLLSNESLRERLRAYERRQEKLNVKEKQEQNAYHMLLEMQLRGINMLPVDLYRSDAKRFLPEEGSLRCPFTAISGIGEAAVEGLIQARAGGKPFLSVEDLRARAHIGDSVVEMLRQQGALEGLPETSQVDLFSLL